MAAGQERAQKRAKVGLNVINDRGDKDANYQRQRPAADSASVSADSS